MVIGAWHGAGTVVNSLGTFYRTLVMNTSYLGLENRGDARVVSPAYPHCVWFLAIVVSVVVVDVDFVAVMAVVVVPMLRVVVADVAVDRSVDGATAVVVISDIFFGVVCGLQNVEAEAANRHAIA